MNSKLCLPAIKNAASPPSRRIGLKAFYLEPWLILGSMLLWLAVLPFAGLLWSGAALWKRAETLA